MIPTSQWLHKQKNGLKKNFKNIYQKDIIMFSFIRRDFIGRNTINKQFKCICGFKSWDFQYTGNVQSFTVPYTGTYMLETWGAQGGNDTLNLSFTYHQGGLGGYAGGEVSLTKGETICVVVGGQGANTPSITNGGYNGGGGNDRSGSAGGGATHIATADGLLASLSNDKSAVLIVAGGGGSVDYGGKFDMEDGGYAGGPSYGNNKTATQTNGYSFGRGESVPFIDSGAGGGGWYGGYHGESKNLYSYGGGGSSYIGGVSDGKTIAGNQSMPSPSGGRKQVKQGMDMQESPLSNLMTQLHLLQPITHQKIG